MQSNIVFILVWLVCGAATIIAGGALLHLINLATGSDYTGFADPAHFVGVTHAWNAVVVPNHVLFIGLLAAFEAAAGVLAISGGRRTQLGYLAMIAFYLALWLFGWIETIWVLVMLPAMLLLLRAEWHATRAVAIEPRPGVELAAK